MNRKLQVSPQKVTIQTSSTVNNLPLGQLTASPVSIERLGASENECKKEGSLFIHENTCSKETHSLDRG